MTDSAQPSRDWTRFTWPRATVIILLGLAAMAVLVVVTRYVDPLPYLSLLFLPVVTISAAWGRRRRARGR